MEIADSRAARRFNTIDGMILVAALGLWLSLMPGYFVNLPRAFRDMCDLGLQLSGLTERSTPGAPQLMWSNLHSAIHNVLAPWPFLFGYLVPSVLILGLRRPRPPGRQHILESGFGSCLLLFLYVFVRLEVRWLGGERLAYAADAVIAAVLLWVVLGRRPWHAEPSWLDRLGRGVATYWILELSIRAADHALFGCMV